MRFWHTWLQAKPLRETLLLDLAIFLSFLPFLWVISSWILLFFLSVLFLLHFSYRPKWLISLVMLLGIVLIGVDYSAHYEWVHLRRITVFASLIAMLLMHAVLLQKLSGEINIYVKLAPLMFFTLSFFFFKDFNMLIYASIMIFIFVLLRLWYQMQTPLIDALKMSSALMLLALPTIVVLFLFFPRIAFEKATFGFTQQQIKRLGHDGTMKIDNSALEVLSKRVVMEVTLPDTKNKRVYFRGSTLYEDHGSFWQPMPFNPLIKAAKDQSSSSRYEVTLYPTHKKYLYSVGDPVDLDKKLQLRHDKTLTRSEKVTKTFHYFFKSVPMQRSELFDLERQMALAVDIKRDDKAYALIQSITDEKQSDSERFKAIENWAYTQKLTYTLQPKPLDLDDPVDDFLFGTQEGYCVHFASSFANLFRLAKLPTRVVTGYLSNAKNFVNNFLLIRQEDAHAWLEVYIKDRWVRVEATAFAYATQSTQRQALEEAKKEQATWWEYPSLYLLYIKHSIDRWVIQYNRSAQKRFISNLLNDIGTLLKFLAAVALMVFITVWAVKKSFKRGVKDPVLKIMAALLKKLAKEGWVKKPDQSMHSFLNSIDRDMTSIDRLYHEVVYAQKKEKLVLLQQEIKKLL